MVVDVGNLNNGDFSQCLDFHSEPTVGSNIHSKWEELQLILLDACPNLDSEDLFIWWQDNYGFLIKYSYTHYPRNVDFF